MNTQPQLETLPSLGETVVLYIIRTNEYVSGYQIRKLFMETTKKGLSFGTLVPMLHRFEKSEFVVKQRDESNPPSYLWHLTPRGYEELESRLALLSNVLRDRRGVAQERAGYSKDPTIQPEIHAPMSRRAAFEW
jgi:DNA-binding PadR family transcriptional regulator